MSSGEHARVTVSMPIEMKEAIDDLVEKRNRTAGGPAWTASAVVRMAVQVYFRSLSPPTHPEVVPDGFGKNRRKE